MPYCVFWGVDKHFEHVLSSNIWHQILVKPVPKPLIHKQKKRVTDQPVIKTLAYSVPRMSSLIQKTLKCDTVGLFDFHTCTCKSINDVEKLTKQQWQCVLTHCSD